MPYRRLRSILSGLNHARNPTHHHANISMQKMPMLEKVIIKAVLSPMSRWTTTWKSGEEVPCTHQYSILRSPAIDQIYVLRDDSKQASDATPFKHITTIATNKTTLDHTKRRRGYSNASMTLQSTALQPSLGFCRMLNAPACCPACLHSSPLATHRPQGIPPSQSCLR